MLEPQVANYEPRSALYAGPTGLEIYQRLIPQARKVLKPRGWLMLEIGYGQNRPWNTAGRLEQVSFVPTSRESREWFKRKSRRSHYFGDESRRDG